ncbi:MAG: hypothetical protein P9L99_00890 [Candidatus Lernaella stagnicola]|nr:hypothetical protein [Candidatus Lernaella stagnicola]
MISLRQPPHTPASSMAFAPGGSGIGIDDSPHRVYLIEGLDITEIYDYDIHEERPSGFLIAADAPVE